MDRQTSCGKEELDPMEGLAAELAADATGP